MMTVLSITQENSLKVTFNTVANFFKKSSQHPTTKETKGTLSALSNEQLQTSHALRSNIRSFALSAGTIV